MKPKIDILNGDTRQCLFAMALPVMLAMVLNMAYNFVDSLWIGNLLGETASAALASVTPVILLLSAIGMGAANGVSILLSQAVGAGERRKRDALMATSLVLCVVCAVGVTALLEGVLDPVLGLLQVPGEIFGMARSYLAIYLVGYSAVCLYCYFAAVLRSFGDTVFQVIAMLVCTLLNALLDPLFIWGLGFPGAAAATVLSQGLCLVFMVLWLRRKGLGSWKHTAFSRQEIVPLLSKSLPAAVQQSIPAISTSVLTALVSGYGVTALAAYGITGKLETILFYPAMALNMVLTAIVGQCAGAGRYDRAKAYCRAALRWGGGLLVVLSAVVVGFSRTLSGLFVDSGEVAEIVAEYFRVVGAGYLLNTVTNCLLGAMNGLGKPGRSVLCMVLYYLAVRLPLAGVLSAMGLIGVWIAVLISHGVAAVTAGVMARREFRRKETLAAR